MLDFAFHGVVQRQMQRPDLIEIPVESGNRIADLEQRHRQVITCRGVVGEVSLGPGGGRVGQQFRIAQRIGDAVGGEWILEVPCIADQRPAWPMRPDV